MLEQYFTHIALGLLLVLMALCAWWAVRSYKAARWGRFGVSVVLLLLMGFGWNFFPVLLFLLLAPVFGWSFS